MMKPDNDRLDYGAQLWPMEGYEFDAAIATTYSLDLNSLLAVPVALCFSDTLDGDLKGEKLALLEALGQLNGRLKVFYHAGNIKVPDQFNRLFTLLEPCLHSIIPPSGANSSFHPKMWLIRYLPVDKNLNIERNVCYRLLVLSRNLTFDRSWDIAAVLEGKLLRSHTNKHANFVSFVNSLLKSSNDFIRNKEFLDEVGRVEWGVPEKFEKVSITVGGGEYGRPIMLENRDVCKLLVVSPFLKDSIGQINGLEWLRQFGNDGKRYLFSRASELNAIGKKELEDWICYSLNDAVLQGEELNEFEANRESAQQDLHAKIIIQQNGEESIWQLGSANATSAAIGEETVSKPRNRELMLRLNSFHPLASVDTLLENWTSKAGNSLFVEHVFSEFSDSDVVKEKDYRKWLHKLVSLKWKLKAKMTSDENKFDLTLVLDELPILAENMKVKVKHLGFPGVQDLALSMTWLGISIDRISALVKVVLEINTENGLQEEMLIIVADLEFDGEDNRQAFIIKSLIDSSDKVLSYLNLLLQRNPDKNTWLSMDEGVAFKGSSFIFDSSPILERLLIASSREPELLMRVKSAIERFESAKVEMPYELVSLWKNFRP